MKEVKFNELPTQTQEKLNEICPSVDIFDIVESYSDEEFCVQLPENFIDIGRDDHRCRSIVLKAYITNRQFNILGVSDESSK